MGHKDKPTLKPGVSLVLHIVFLGELSKKKKTAIDGLCMVLPGHGCTAMGLSPMSEA
jgi:hypothetical protein